MWLVIHNPVAGRSFRQWRVRRALAEIARRHPDVRIEATRRADDTGPIVRECLRAGVTRVYVCGGDGTVGVVAREMVGSAVPLGVLPGGTTNVIARELGLSMDPLRATRQLLGPVRERPFRTWRTEYGSLILALGVGYDARPMWYTPARFKRLVGLPAVLFEGIRAALRYEFPALEVEVEAPNGSTAVLDATWVVACNTTLYAGTVRLSERGDPGDDELELLIFQRRTFAALFMFWLQMGLPGTAHLQQSGVRLLRARGFRVTSRAGYEVEAHLNGDPCGRTPISARLDGEVRLLAPA